MGTDKRIIVGFDGSPSSVAALRWALAEGRALPATVTAVEVCPPETTFLPATSMSLHPRGTVPHSGLSPLARIAGQVADEAGARLEVRRVSGRTGKALAETGDADLIVIGAHHRAMNLTTGMGAFAMDCVRHARCPVAIVPENA
ncbi:universal stress protein [Actinokineospora sp. 24-640]